jgi:hypothetical protein
MNDHGALKGPSPCSASSLRSSSAIGTKRKRPRLTHKKAAGRPSRSPPTRERDCRVPQSDPAARSNFPERRAPKPSASFGHPRRVRLEPALELGDAQALERYPRLAVRPQAEGTTDGRVSVQARDVGRRTCDPSTLESIVPDWNPGDSICLGHRELRGAGIRGDDGDQPPVLVVQDMTELATSGVA